MVSLAVHQCIGLKYSSSCKVRRRTLVRNPEELILTHLCQRCPELHQSAPHGLVHPVWKYICARQIHRLSREME